MPEEPHEAHRAVCKMNFPRQGRNTTPGGNTDTFLVGFKKNNSLCPEEWIAACEGKARLTHWGWGRDDNQLLALSASPQPIQGKRLRCVLGSGKPSQQ